MRKVQTSVFCWPAIERMQRIHRLIENKEYPNCRKMAREFEMSVRTLKRDIDFMKTRLNLPIGFDGQHNGYYYTKPVPQFPQMPMSEADIFTMFVANRAIEQYHGTPLQKMLETTFRKLTGRRSPPALDCELVHDEPIVGFWGLEVEEPGLLGGDATILPAITDVHAVRQHFVKSSVV